MSLDLDRSGWKPVALGDVAQVSKEKCNPADGSVDRYVAGEHMVTDDLRVARWGTVGDGYLGPAFHRRFRPGDVLYGSRRTYLRKVAVADFDGVCANTTFVVQTRDPNVLSPGFLPWVMTSEPFHAFAISESRGSVNPYVNWSDIERFALDLPPLNEQARIADLLWSIERQRKASAELLRATVHAMEVDRLHLICRGTQRGRGVAPLSLDAFHTWTADLPAGWTAKRIKDVAEVRSGATPSGPSVNWRRRGRRA